MADDVATLGIEVDTGQVKTGADDLRNFQRIARETGETTEQVQARFKALSEARKTETAATQQSATMWQRALDYLKSWFQTTNNVNTATTALVATQEKHSKALRSNYDQLLTVNKLFNQFQHEAQSLGGELGRVGAFLIALGPAGVAVAAALGAVALVVHSVVEAALKLGEVSAKLRDLSESTGFTTDQLQALQRAGAEVGLDAGRISTGLERFSIAMAEVHKGTGALYTDLLAIDPELAKQLAQTKNLSDAWDILAKAIATASTEELRNQIARAAFSRFGGAGFARLANVSTEAGGVDKLTESMNQLDLLTKQQIDNFAKLARESEENFAKAGQNIVSTFAGPVLNNLHKVSEEVLVFSRAIKSVDLKEWNTGWTSWLAYTVPVAGQLDLIDDGLKAFNINVSAMDWGSWNEGWKGWLLYLIPIVGQIKALKDFRQWWSSSSAPTGPLPSAPTHGPASESARAAAEANQVAMQAAKDAAKAEQEHRQAIIFTSNETIRKIQVLGSAATIDEQYRLKQAQLNKTLAEQKDVTGEVARARAEAGFERQQEIIQTRETLTVASQEEITLARIAKARHDAARAGVKDAMELAEAGRVAAKEARQAFEEMKIKASDFPGLTRLSYDFRNLNKQLDEFGVSVTNNVVKSLADITSGTVQASEGFKQLGLSVLRLLQEMIIKMLIAVPLAESLKAAFSVTGGGSFGGIFGFLSGTKHSGGIVGEPGPMRFVDPRVFANAPHFASGGIVPGEVPIIAHTGEGIFTPKQMAAMGKSETNVTIKMDFTGHTSNEDVAKIAEAAARRGVAQAVAISSAGAPARQKKYSMLGT